MKKLLLSFMLFGIMSSLFSLPTLLNRKQFNVHDINDLAIDLSWENLELQECNDSSTILVEIYCNKKDYAPQLSTRGSKLVVKSKKNTGFFSRHDCTVILKLPSSKTFDVSAFRTTSGHIQCQAFLKTNNLTVQTTSGYTSFTVPSYADISSFDATSGNIFIDSLYGKKLQIKATSSSIKVEKFEGDYCSVHATSGSIKLREISSKEVYINATSGSITVEGDVTNSLGINATSGTVGVELETVPEENTMITTTSGTIFTAFPENADYSVMVTTVSGAFINAITGETIISSVHYKRNINEGGPFVMLTATSGRITLDSTNSFASKTTEVTENPDIPVVSFDDPIFNE